MIAMLDTLEWPVVFLGCILAGVVPVAANTLLTTKDFDFMLRDSRAQALFVSKPLLPTFEPLIGTHLHRSSTVVVAGDTAPNSVAALIQSGGSGASKWPAPAPTTPASGSIPAAPPARPRAPCTCTAT